MAAGEYARPIEILVVCTANQCRSPMAATALRRHLASAGVIATVSSAGVAAAEGMPATDFARLVTGSLDDHRSRRLVAAEAAAADLILCMERGHVREVLLLAPDAFPRTFALKELVRLGGAAGRRRRGEDLAAWLTRAANGRTQADLLGGAAADDVADPIGQPMAAYEATRAELDTLLGELVALAFSRQ